MMTVTTGIVIEAMDPLAAARAELLGNLDVHPIPGTPEPKSSGFEAYDLLPPEGHWKDPRCAQ